MECEDDVEYEVVSNMGSFLYNNTVLPKYHRSLSGGDHLGSGGYSRDCRPDCCRTPVSKGIFLLAMITS